MASKSLTNTNISNTYVGVLHAKGAPLPATGSEYIYDGFGNRSGLRLGRDEIDISGTLGADFATAAAKALFPVGSVMFSADDVNPTQRFAGTKWEQVAEGRFIAGVGEGTDKNAATQTVAAGDDTTVGEYSHTLTVPEMPAHSHTQLGGGFNGSDGIEPGSRRTQDLGQTGTTGTNQSHNNIPPTFGLYVWKRTA